MSTEPELLPCPFCGHPYPAIRQERHAVDWIVIKVFCAICEATGGDGTTIQEAVARWNRRLAPRETGEPQ